MRAMHQVNEIVSKSRADRKYVIAGVTCAVVVALVIAGSLVGVKFFLSSTSDLVKVERSNFLISTPESSLLVLGCLTIVVSYYVLLVSFLTVKTTLASPCSGKLGPRIKSESHSLNFTGGGESKSAIFGLNF